MPIKHSDTMHQNIYYTHKCSELTDVDSVKNTRSSRNTENTNNTNNDSLANSTITIAGWVHRMRDHGNLLFIDLRDHSEIMQCVVANNSAAFETAQKLTNESVVKITGILKKRLDGTENQDMHTGRVELIADSITILSKAMALPFQVNTEDKVSEDLRLQYRFIDLRRKGMNQTLTLRSKIIKFIRDIMWDSGFMEMQTPILTASSPEGARDYVVPSRIHPGKFYALPQAPQQFKQLIMASGFENYFQIAPCFRDEDSRADRLPGEFYQLDIEMAFATEEKVFNAIEPIMRKIFEKFTDKPVSQIFHRITYKQSLKIYGSDKPDLRNKLIVTDTTEMFKNANFKIFKDGIAKGYKVRGIAMSCRKNTDAITRKTLDQLNAWAQSEGMPGLGYVLFQNGEAKGPIAKQLNESRLCALNSLIHQADSLDKSNDFTPPLYDIDSKAHFDGLSHSTNKNKTKMNLSFVKSILLSENFLQLSSSNLNNTSDSQKQHNNEDALTQTQLIDFQNKIHTARYSLVQIIIHILSKINNGENNGDSFKTTSGCDQILQNIQKKSGDFVLSGNPFVSLRSALHNISHDIMNFKGDNLLLKLWDFDAENANANAELNHTESNALFDAIEMLKILPCEYDTGQDRVQGKGHDHNILNVNNEWKSAADNLLKALHGNKNFLSKMLDAIFVLFCADIDLNDVKSDLINDKCVNGYKDGVVFFTSSEDPSVSSGLVRQKIAEYFNMVDLDRYEFCWIKDFPFYEMKDGKVEFSHNPFSMPKGGMQALLNQAPEEIYAEQYDIACNGLELSSGAIRNHLPEVMYKAFEIAGYANEAVDERFGALIKAFKYGVPPHGGIAPGIDRIIMLLTGAKNLREVTLYPLNQQAQDLMMNAPSAIDSKHQKELGLKSFVKE